MFTCDIDIIELLWDSCYYSPSLTRCTVPELSCTLQCTAHSQPASQYMCIDYYSICRQMRFFSPPIFQLYMYNCVWIVCNVQCIFIRSITFSYSVCATAKLLIFICVVDEMIDYLLRYPLYV